MIHSSLTERKLNEVRKVLATDDMVIIVENQNIYISLEQISNVNGFTGCGC